MGVDVHTTGIPETARLDQIENAILVIRPVSNCNTWLTVIVFSVALWFPIGSL